MIDKEASKRVVLSFLNKIAAKGSVAEDLVETSMELAKLEEALKNNEKYESLNTTSMSSVDRREHREEQSELKRKIDVKKSELQKLTDRIGK